MNAKKILSWLLLLFGEAVIVAAFILFRGDLPDNILVLNIVVSSVIYGVFFLNYRIPWIDLNEKAPKQIGALGVSWLTTWIYAVAAVAVMLIGNLVFDLAFATQLLIHCGLLFLFLSGMLAARYSADKVRSVHAEQTSNRNGIEEMKKAIRNLKDKMNETENLPANFAARIDALEENLRFVSPSGSEEAHALEDSFAGCVREIGFAIADYSMNEERIDKSLKKLERIYENRKNIYSN